MIDRENWKAARAYLAYRSEVYQLSDGSARLEKSWLRHLLEWAQDRPFTDAPRIRPAFPIYALAARLDGAAGDCGEMTLGIGRIPGETRGFKEL